MFKYALAIIIALSTTAKADIIESTADMLIDIEMQIALNEEEIPFMTPPTDKVGLSEVQCLAVAAYFEARDQGLYGQVAVASVILQRTTVPGRWGNTVCDVVTGVQFSFMTSDTTFPEITEMNAWASAVAVADNMITAGPIPDLPFADHYHATYVKPYWRKHMTKVAQIGTHIFYADPISIRRISLKS